MDDSTPSGWVFTYDGGWSSLPLVNLGNNSFQHVPVGKAGVDELRIKFKSSGALAKITFNCP